MLTSIKIEKLFNTFDYDIQLKPEGITILTGPNGYGKTTVLKILDALARQNPFFFMGLPFVEIQLKFSDRNEIQFTKKEHRKVVIKTDNESKPLHIDEKLLSSISQRIPYLKQIDDSRWLDRRTDDFFASEELFQRVLSENPEFAKKLHIIDLPEIPSVYFIGAQRLLRPILDAKRISRRHYMDDEKPAATFENTIEEYARELGRTIKETLARSSQIGQTLDSSFPRRLFDQTSIISEEEFSRRFEVIKATQKALSHFGLSKFEEDTHPTYKATDARALFVYIEDTEKKLLFFTELLQKLTTFTEMLNEHRFSFKRIQISKDCGFKFTTDDGSPLTLSDLSSGEQQEVVMLYELLFKVEPGTLVLIDEPELSLHVVWQMQFLNDLARIVELRKIHVIVATHSPQIIDSHWDWVVDLGDLHSARHPG